MSPPANRAERMALIEQFDRGCITQALRLLPLHMDSPRARAMLLKIGLQEGRLYYRDQVTKGKQFLGPALSPWQFERGGVRGVMNHKATQPHAKEVCRALNIPFQVETVWRAFLTNDVLAAAFARLNLYWAAGALPEVSDGPGSWAYYVNCWRPGKPHPSTWTDFHAEVLAYFSKKA